MAWSAFGVVPFSRHEVCDWWRLFGVPIFCWCWRVSWGDQRSLFQTEGTSPVWCWISFSSFGRRQATGLPRTTSWGATGRTGFTTTWFSARVGSTSFPKGWGVSTAHCRWSWWHGCRCRWGRWRSWAHDDRQGRWGFRRGRIWGGRRGCVVEQPYSWKPKLMCGTLFVWESLVVFSLSVREMVISLKRTLEVKKFGSISLKVLLTSSLELLWTLNRWNREWRLRYSSLSDLRSGAALLNGMAGHLLRRNKSRSWPHDGC